MSKILHVMIIALPETAGIKIFHHILLQDCLSEPWADFPSWWSITEVCPKQAFFPLACVTQTLTGDLHRCCVLMRFVVIQMWYRKHTQLEWSGGIVAGDWVPLAGSPRSQSAAHCEFPVFFWGGDLLKTARWNYVRAGGHLPLWLMSHSS